MTKTICSNCQTTEQRCRLTMKVREELLRFMHQRKLAMDVDRLLYEYLDAYPFGSVEGFGQFVRGEKLVVLPRRPVPTRVKLTPGPGPSLADVLDELRGNHERE